MLIPLGVTLVLFVVQYRFRSLPSGVLVLISVVALCACGSGVWLAVADYPHVQTPAIPPRPGTAPQTSIEQIFPPQSAVDIRPIPGTQNLSFFLANWVSWSVSNIQLSSWMSENGSFVRVSSNQYPYLGAGDQTTLTIPVASTGRSAVAICMSYLVNHHHVEVIQFFSNSDGGGYRRARDNTFKVDGDGELCESMPQSALQALRQ